MSSFLNTESAVQNQNIIKGGGKGGQKGLHSSLCNLALTFTGVMALSTSVHGFHILLRKQSQLVLISLFYSK